MDIDYQDSDQNTSSSRPKGVKTRKVNVEAITALVCCFQKRHLATRVLLNESTQHTIHLQDSDSCMAFPERTKETRLYTFY